jgi:hypothetical protein
MVVLIVGSAAEGSPGAIAATPLTPNNILVSVSTGTDKNLSIIKNLMVIKDKDT